MINTTLSTLFKHVRRTGRSLLQYAAESYPWVKDTNGLARLATLQKMILEEQQATGVIIKFLMRRHVTPPHQDPYPMHFTYYNFLAVDRLLQLIAEDQARDVTEMEADLRAVKDPDAKQLLQNLLEAKRCHLEALQKMKDQPNMPESMVPAAV
jgi:hypothetical protein